MDAHQPLNWFVESMAQLRELQHQSRDAQRRLFDLHDSIERKENQIRRAAKQAGCHTALALECV